MLNAVLLWLMVLPLTGITLLGETQERSPLIKDITQNGIVWGETDLRPIILIIVGQLALSLVLLWGIACILLVGKRMITSRAGRSRSSFKTVRKQGGKFVLTLFLTGILRDCITILWGLLLIIPGIIYAIRTAFYHVAIVCEGFEYRGALNHSKQVVIGHTWIAFWYLLGLSILLFLPVVIVTSLLDKTATLLDSRLLPAVFILDSTVISLALLLFTLATIRLYGEIQKLPPRIHTT